MEKTIIALQAKYQSGKTSTLKLLAKSLNQRYQNSRIVGIFPSKESISPDELNSFLDKKGDIVIRFELENEKKIGVITYGDPTESLPTYLKVLIDEYNCEVIFCGCRTRGKTLNRIKEYQEKGYKIKIHKQKLEYDEAKQEQNNNKVVEELIKLAILPL